MDLTVIVFPIAACVLGFLIGYFLKKFIALRRKKNASEIAKNIIDEAKKTAENLKKEASLHAKDYMYKARGDFDRETSDRRKEIRRLEKRLISKEENIDKKADLIEKKEGEFRRRERELSGKEKEVDINLKDLKSKSKEYASRIERMSDMTSEEAKAELIRMIEDEARHEAAKTIKQIQEETKVSAEKKSKEIISMAIQRWAGEYVSEKTVAAVGLPNDEMKGRIIGREGRNIRSIESATGVDLIVDDTPETVILSTHNPIRREIARLSLEKLISDGRIHPARIEEIVEKTKKEINKAIVEAGEKATFDVGVHGLHQELIRLLGKLLYRTSFAQNIYHHSIEVAFMCGIMAAELGLNQKQARRSGLLHDIGKAVDYEIEGSHAEIGANLLRKYGESKDIQLAVSGHHEDKPPTILAILVQAADALSAARPGARREIWESYIKRLEDLEQIACSFPGVEKAYAVSAGREIRIIVENHRVSDSDAVVLSRDIANKIEKDMSYPGQIKVNVIRETRVIEYAR